MYPEIFNSVNKKSFPGQQRMTNLTMSAITVSVSGQALPVGYVGKMLEGFSLSSKTLKPKKTFPPPSIPPGYRPVHQFRKKFEKPKDSNDDSSSSAVTHNALSRGLIIGETPIVSKYPIGSSCNVLKYCVISYVCWLF